MMLQRCPILGLVKQVLPSKDSCWLASANGVVTSSSPGEGRTGALDQQQQQQQQSSSSRRAAAAAVQQQQHYQLPKEGQLQQQQTAADKKGYILHTYTKKTIKNSCP